MFKPMLLLAAMTLAGSVESLAQAPKVTLSEAFDEPKEGALRLLLLENGNTMLLNFTKKHGIQVTVYDTKHRQKVSNTIQGDAWRNRDMKKSTLKGLYEINGEVVLFLVQMHGRTGALYRIRIDPGTARVSKEEQLSKLPKRDYMPPKNYFYGFRGGDFFVDKDANSGYYAVTRYCLGEDNISQQLEVTHYAPDHHEINHSFYQVPGSQFKHVEYQTAVVHKDDYVFLTAYGYDNSKNRNGHLIISRLDKGATSFQNAVLDFTNGYEEPLSGAHFDSTNNTIRMMTVTGAHHLALDKSIRYHDWKYVSMMSCVDPLKLQVLTYSYLGQDHANDYMKQHLGYKKDYYGLPQDFTVNPDGSYTISAEDMENITTQSTPLKVGNSSTGTSHNNYSYTLGTVAITNLDAQGKERDGFAIPKKQETGGHTQHWSHYRQDRGCWTFRNNAFVGNSSEAAFFSYTYLHPLNKEYILFNDYDDNIKLAPDTYKDLRVMRFVSGSNTVCYSYANGQLNKFYLYGDSKNKEINRYTYLEATVHTQDQHKMVTIMVEKDGHKDQQAHVAWIDFE